MRELLPRQRPRRCQLATRGLVDVSFRRVWGHVSKGFWAPASDQNARTVKKARARCGLCKMHRHLQPTVH